MPSPPPDYEIRQSGRVLEVQNRDLWLRPTDISWLFPTLMTIREELFLRTFFQGHPRSRRPRRTRSMKIKKKKTKNGDDEWNDAERSWQQPVTLISSSSSTWQPWSSDETCERSAWQSSVDWNSPNHTRERYSWQSRFKWR